jgi:hypothetical protein
VTDQHEDQTPEQPHVCQPGPRRPRRHPGVAAMSDETVARLRVHVDEQIERLLGYTVEPDGRTWCRRSTCGLEVTGISVSDSVTSDADWGVWTTTLTRTVTLHPCGHQILGTVST